MTNWLSDAPGPNRAPDSSYTSAEVLLDGVIVNLLGIDCDVTLNGRPINLRSGNLLIAAGELYDPFPRGRR